MATSISVTDAQQLFTKQLTAVLTDRLEPTPFGRSFFKETESWTKEISLQVSRIPELIAKDTVRGTEGNRNIFGKSTEKIVVPPYYHEYLDVTQLDGYDQLYADPSALISTITFDRFLQTVSEKLMLLQDKIDRAYEKQAWDVFLTGKITLADGSQIDYKRQSTSIVDLGSGNYWDGASVDPNTVLEAAAKFIRIQGKSPATTYNVIMGDEVYAKYISNAAVLKRGAIFNWNMDRLLPAQKNAAGWADHGTISAGSYNFNLMTYPQFYDTISGGTVTKGTPYLDSKSIIVIPQETKNVLAYAAVPQLLSTGQTPVKGKWMFYNFPDPRLTAHVFGVKSAGVAMPVAVDQIYTAQVLA